MHQEDMSALFQFYLQFMFWQACFPAPILDVATTLVCPLCWWEHMERQMAENP